MVTKSNGFTLIHQKVLANPSLNAASINYRLSPHPSYADEDNNAFYPDHLNDVLSALLYLKVTHGMSAKRFILTGHSAGATLIFQAIPKLTELSFPPSAAVGASGFYDVAELIEEYPNYLDFISSSLGEDRELWKIVSPALVGRESAAYADYAGKIVLIHSDDDELLSWKQTLGFRDIIDAQPGREGNKALVMATKGKHDEVPEGKALSDAVDLLLKDLTH